MKDDYFQKWAFLRFYSEWNVDSRIWCQRASDLLKMAAAMIGTISSDLTHAETILQVFYL